MNVFPSTAAGFRIGRWLCAWGVLGLLLLSGNTALAQVGFTRADKVTLELPNGSQIVMRGTIVTYTGKLIRVQTSPTGPPAEWPAESVLSVETPQTESQIAGLQLFQAGDYAGAEKSLEVAYTLDSRDWVKRDILTLLIRCDLKQGEYISAGQRFVILYRNDPTTQAIRYMPLSWTPMPVEGALKTAAEGWLSQSEDAIRLMGASFLLNDFERDEIALTQCRRMLASSDERVRALAKAQVWRSQLNPQLLDLQMIRRWESQLREIPPQFRAGAYYVLGQAYYLRQDYTQAAASLLWLPIVHPDDAVLAARACLEAADAMRLLRDESAAMRLYQEVADRFPQTESAQIARDILKERAGNSE